MYTYEECTASIYKTFISFRLRLIKNLLIHFCSNLIYWNIYFLLCIYIGAGYKMRYHVMQFWG